MKKQHARRTQNTAPNGVGVDAGMRACGYYRASTPRQIEAELTIPSHPRG